MGPRAIVFDITGTLRLGVCPIPGAPSVIEALRAAGYVLRCLSNNPRETPAQVAASLNDQGLFFKTSEVLTANEVAAQFFGQPAYAGKRVLVLGSPALRQQVGSRGAIVEDDGKPDAVLVAMSGASIGGVVPPDVDRAIAEIERGAEFLATGLDPWIPDSNGRFLPAAGSLVQAIARVTGREPTVIAKPSAFAAEVLQTSLGLRGRDIVMVGDHLEADVALGKGMGALTALVLTGCALPWERRVLERSEDPPDVILDSVRDLPAWLNKLGTPTGKPIPDLGGARIDG